MKLSRFVLLPLLSLACVRETAQASLTPTQWFFGNWNCSIDGRPTRMNWRVANDTQVDCAGGVCTVVNGVKVVGRFSDSGSAWIPLKRTASTGTTLSIRYMGREQDNWFLRRTAARQADGWTTWRGSRYPLKCSQ